MIASVVRRIQQMHTAGAQGASVALAEPPIPPLTFQQASEWQEVREAFSLLYRSYRKKGLISQNPYKLRVTHYNLLPESGSFVVKADDEVIATLSVLADSRHFGLPMAELYRAELADLRADGRSLAEISGLAIDRRYSPLSILLVMNLVKMLYRYSVKLGVTDLVAACHPRHARLYQRLFLFEPIGELRTYRSVNDAPAIALRLDLTHVKERYQDVYHEDGFTLYRFLFSDEVFKCSGVALCVGAFSQRAVRELLMVQPEFAHILEAERPGLVRELTGQRDLAEFGQGRWSAFAGALSPVPAFVPG